MGAWKADLFGPPDPAQSVPVLLEAGFQGFVVKDQTGRTLEIPFEGARLSRGGFDGLGIVIEGTAVTGEALYLQLQNVSLLVELQENGPLALREMARRLIAEGKSTERSWFFSGVFLVLFIIGSIVFLVFGLSIASEKAVEYIPHSAEASLGEITAKSILSGRQELKSGPLYDAVKKIWDATLKGVSSSPWEFRLYVANSSMVNALAAPGGHVVVFTGLLEKLESPEELAGILAHEMQHALKRHGLKNLIKRAGVSVSLGIILGDTGMLGELFKTFGGQLLTMSYSRDAEREADRGAIEILQAADIDPTQFPNFFTRAASGSLSLGGTLAILSTHPDDKERVAYLQSEFGKLPKKSWKPLDVNWKEVRGLLTAAPPPTDPGLH
jgi:Zn-dependent protease with chaperone function